ncbi:MAG TPA: hypothetical protein VFC78_18935 [Tepidisphaeraceae bacterium]|nr:hypothetical protein [Tepidisphaeraceae bacterium]
MDASPKQAAGSPVGAIARRTPFRMLTHSIANDWSLVVEDEFVRKIIDGEVMLHMPGRTIYCSVYQTNNATAEDAIQKMIEGRPGIPVQIFDREEPGLCGHGYLLPEIDNGNKYWGLNTWTAARGSVCCVTLYFQDFEDFNWAIGIWKSVRPRRDTNGRLN